MTATLTASTTYIERIGFESGVYFTMEITPLEDGFYKCYGYAMAHGSKLTDWQYIATDWNDARDAKTAEYLLRELRPLARTQLMHISNIANQWILNNK